MDSCGHCRLDVPPDTPCPHVDHFDARLTVPSTSRHGSKEKCNHELGSKQTCVRYSNKSQSQSERSSRY